MKRAFFFDLGGTLFSNLMIPRVNGETIIEAGQRLGVEGGFEKVGLAYVTAAREVNDLYMRRDYYSHRDHFYDTYRAFAKRFGQEADEAFLTWFYEAQREAMHSGITLREDCVSTLTALRENGKILSIVSNIDDDYLDGWLIRLDLAVLFDHWISSEAAQSCKPHHRIFERALEQAGCVAGEVVFVGDSRIHDIQGARALGMTTVLLDEKGASSHLDDIDFEAEPDYVISTLSELLDLDEARPQGG
ncbi:MAG: HAD family hydrolase [Myxococcota bacterium]|nr:HAD family hydrolase [Myxococcota bacterium]